MKGGILAGVGVVFRSLEVQGVDHPCDHGGQENQGRADHGAEHQVGDLGRGSGSLLAEAVSQYQHGVSFLGWVELYQEYFSRHKFGGEMSSFWPKPA